MKKVFLAAFALILANGPASASDYQAAVGSWKSHEDVATWMKDTWRFDDHLAKKVVKTIRSQGPAAAPVKSPEETFRSPRGWCKDAANFTKEALNAVDPGYGAEYIFIKNKVSSAPNHWVAGFKRDGQIYVIDYGAGSHWESMMGVHGPYDSLDGYRDFLAGLNLKNFSVDFVKWMPSRAAAPKKAASAEERIAHQRAKVVLAKFDKNGDNGISKNEAPPPMKANFDRLDKNADGSLSEEELHSLPPR